MLYIYDSLSGVRLVLNSQTTGNVNAQLDASSHWLIWFIRRHAVLLLIVIMVITPSMS